MNRYLLIALAFVALNCSAVIMPSGNVGSLNFNGAPLVVPNFNSTNRIVAGTFDEGGNFEAVPVSPADYFNGMVFQVDSNGFAVLGGTLYNKGALNGGSYLSLDTNLVSLFQSFSFTTNNRVIIGSVPSFKSAKTIGLWAAAPPMLPPAMPSLQISTDSGATWIAAKETPSPVLVSFYKSDSLAGGCTNLQVFSFINPAVYGQTNDLRNQFTQVTQFDDGSSVANVNGVKQLAAEATKLWANSVATADVNLGGHDLIATPDWRVTFTNSVVTWKYQGATVLSISPAIATNTAPSFASLSKSGTNLTFQIVAVSTPTVQWRPDLVTGTWLTLSNQTVTQIGGVYSVTAPAPSATNAFFRCSVTGLASAPAKMTFAGVMACEGSGIYFTNANGKKFTLIVNASTNGFTFVPSP